MSAPVPPPTAVPAPAGAAPQPASPATSLSVSRPGDRGRPRAAGLAAAAWPALAALLALLAWLLLSAHSATWDWQPALAWREPWRWWSAAGVHWSGAHLAMNLAGCAVLALLGWRAGLGPRATLAWALAWPLTQLGLLLQPALLHYGGLSGVLHAGVAIVAWHLLNHERGLRRAIGGLLAVGLLAKVIAESPWGAATRTLPGWDFAVAPLAHASGALAGLGCAALLDRRRVP